MKTTVVAARALTAAQIRSWRAIQAAEPGLASPLLSPEFTQAVAAVRNDVYVGVIEQDGGAVGFFPHQRGWLSMGRPVGGPLNTLQAVVAPSHVEWDATALIKTCGLSEWTFTRALASQRGFVPYHLRQDVSLFIDLSRGYDAYAEEKHSSFRSYDILRRTRKLERDAGALRFEFHSSDAAPLAALLHWKRVRYARQPYDNIFAAAWVRRILEGIHATQTAGFAGVLSVMYAGHEMAAAHFGVRAAGLLHSLVFSYNPRFARYSPGVGLFLRIAEAAPGFGVQRIEVGGGDYPYKRLLANDTITVASGTVDRMPALTAVRRWREHGADAIRGSRLLRPPARVVLRTCRRLRQSLPA